MSYVRVLFMCIMLLLSFSLTHNLWGAHIEKQRDYWRCLSTDEHRGAGSVGGGSWSVDSRSTYYYNNLIPTQVDSTLVHVDVDYRNRDSYYYIITYSYLYFPEFYEVYKKQFDGDNSTTQCNSNRLYRYNYDGLIIYQAELTISGDAINQYTEYIYNQSGMLLEKKKYVHFNYQDNLTNHEICTYNDNNQMLTRVVKQSDHLTDEMVINRTEDMYYSVYTAPDSLYICDMYPNPYIISYKQNNVFDQNGNVVFITNVRTANSSNPSVTITETNLSYQLSPNGYVPTLEKAYIRNGLTMALQDSIDAYYTYSPDYLHIQYHSFQHQAYNGVNRDSLYNYAGLTVSSSYSEYSMFEGSSISLSNVWSYCTGIEDEIQTSTLVPEINVAPNPFSGSTTIKIDLVDENVGKVNIYNLKGQSVRTFSYLNLSKGANYLKWDGKDDRNQQLASGVYIIHVSTPYGSSNRKLILVK